MDHITAEPFVLGGIDWELRVARVIPQDHEWLEFDGESAECFEI